jgi:hypothetical protein
MCCQSTRIFGLPAEVIEAQAHYERLRQEHGYNWFGEYLPEWWRWVRFFMSTSPPFAPPDGLDTDLGAAVRSLLAVDVPAGVVVITIAADGSLAARTGPGRPAIVGHTVPIDVIFDSAATADLTVIVERGQDVETVIVPSGGVALLNIDLDGGVPELTLRQGEHQMAVTEMVTVCDTSALHLVSQGWSRWSVTDSSGGAWFPPGVLRKWDGRHQPFFHAAEVTFAVPTDTLRVVCARGMEFERVERSVVGAANQTTDLVCNPARLFDPAADGWYGGDLHVHLNYSGDLVCTLEDAALMQQGEGLHLLNLVAGNLTVSRVYDRELLEAFVGTDLPWSDEDAVARMGVEYRNDLLGHMHGLGPSRPPVAYHSGHEHSDHPEDWPPNSAACEDLRSAGATVGYAHPVFEPFPEDGSTASFLRPERSVEARELVADAALGLVDSVDLISPFSSEGAIYLYHRLLSCGLRLAATAGTDVFLSFANGPWWTSSPPGRGRVYANLGADPLSVDAFKTAIRDGRTIVTNGPWLSLQVNGQSPGSVLDVSEGDTVTLRAEVQGPGAERLSLVGPDGILAETDADSVLEHDLTVSAPSWVAAIARGGPHPNTLDESVVAHTSPVYLDIAGRRVARPADAHWCLDLLNRLENLVSEHGHFHPTTRTAHLEDFVDVLNQARTFYQAVAANG